MFLNLQQVQGTFKKALDCNLLCFDTMVEIESVCVSINNFNAGVNAKMPIRIIDKGFAVTGE